MNLAEASKLKDEFKNRADIESVEEKERVAIAKGLPLQAFYFLKWNTWKKVCKRYHRNLDTMQYYREEYEAFCGKNLWETPLKDWYHDFGAWAKSQKIYWY